MYVWQPYVRQMIGVLHTAPIDLVGYSISSSIFLTFLAQHIHYLPCVRRFPPLFQLTDERLICDQKAQTIQKKNPINIKHGWNKKKIVGHPESRTWMSGCEYRTALSQINMMQTIKMYNWDDIHHAGGFYLAEAIVLRLDDRIKHQTLLSKYSRQYTGLYSNPAPRRWIIFEAQDCCINALWLFRIFFLCHSRISLPFLSQLATFLIRTNIRLPNLLNRRPICSHSMQLNKPSLCVMRDVNGTLYRQTFSAGYRRRAFAGLEPIFDDEWRLY